MRYIFVSEVYTDIDSTFASSNNKQIFYSLNKVIMTRKVYVRNQFDVRIKKCCASCAFKDLTRAVTERYCTEHAKTVKACEVCKSWRMSSLLQSMQLSDGQVKRREYQLYLLKVRTEELEKKVKKQKSIELIREEFESQYGSVFI